MAGARFLFLRVLFATQGRQRALPPLQATTIACAVATSSTSAAIYCVGMLQLCLPGLLALPLPSASHCLHMFSALALASICPADSRLFLMPRHSSFVSGGGHSAEHAQIVYSHVWVGLVMSHAPLATSALRGCVPAVRVAKRPWRPQKGEVCR